MAGSTDRIQVVISALDKTKDEIGQSKKNLKSLEKEMADLNREVANGGTEARKALEQKRRAYDAELRKMEQLKREQDELKRKQREYASTVQSSSRGVSAAFDKVTRSIGLTGDKVDAVSRRIRAFETRFRGSLDRIKNRTDRLHTALSGVRRMMGLSIAAAAASAGTLAVLGVKEYADAEAAQNKLANAYKRFPRLADMPIEKLRELNTQLQMHTRFDDDDTAAMQANLSRFGVTGKQLANLTPLVADLAQAQGTDMVTAGDRLGKAFLGNTRALKALGINYTATGNRAKDMANITKLLNKQVGGESTKAAKTTAVKMEILKNQWGEFKETIGLAVLPIFRRFVRVAGPAVTKFADTVKKYMPQIRRFFRQVGDAVGAVIDFFKRNPEVLKAAGIAIGVLAVALGILTIAVWALNTALLANPITWIILAVVALIGVIAYLYFKFEGVRKVVNFVFRSIGAYLRILFRLFRIVWGGIFRVIGAVIRWIVKTAWPAIKSFALAIGRFFRGAYDRVKDVWGKIVTAIRNAKNRIGEIIQNIKNAIKGIWDGITGGLAEKIDQAKQFLKDLFPGLSALPWFFAGGEVTAGTRAVVGEIGPELFVPAFGEPEMIGLHGAEIRNFAEPGVIIPNHLVAQVAMPRQRETVGVAAGPSVQIGEIHVADQFDVEAALTTAMLRAQRIERERR